MSSASQVNTPPTSTGNGNGALDRAKAHESARANESAQAHESVRMLLEGPLGRNPKRVRGLVNALSRPGSMFVAPNTEIGRSFLKLVEETDRILLACERHFSQRFDAANIEQRSTIEVQYSKVAEQLAALNATTSRLVSDPRGNLISHPMTREILEHSKSSTSGGKGKGKNATSGEAAPKTDE